jgi:hypothetical protein
LQAKIAERQAEIDEYEEQVNSTENMPEGPAKEEAKKKLKLREAEIEPKRKEIDVLRQDLAIQQNEIDEVLLDHGVVKEEAALHEKKRKLKKAQIGLQGLQGNERAAKLKEIDELTQQIQTEDAALREGEKHERRKAIGQKQGNASGAGVVAASAYNPNKDPSIMEEWELELTTFMNDYQAEIAVLNNTLSVLKVSALRCSEQEKNAKQAESADLEAVIAGKQKSLAWVINAPNNPTWMAKHLHDSKECLIPSCLFSLIRTHSVGGATRYPSTHGRDLVKGSNVGGPCKSRGRSGA